MRKQTEQESAAEKDTIIIVILVTILLGALVVFSGLFNGFLQIIILTGMAFSFVVARLGKERKIGYLRAFLVSSFFSPILGLLVTLASPRLEDEEYKERMLEVAEGRSASASASSIADQLYKLNELRKEGVLTEAEFERQKENLLNAN